MSSDKIWLCQHNLVMTKFDMDMRTKDLPMQVVRDDKFEIHYKNKLGDIYIFDICRIMTKEQLCQYKEDYEGKRVGGTIIEKS